MFNTRRENTFPVKTLLPETLPLATWQRALRPFHSTSPHNQEGWASHSQAGESTTHSPALSSSVRLTPSCLCTHPASPLRVSETRGDEGKAVQQDVEKHENRDKFANMRYSGTEPNC